MNVNEKKIKELKDAFESIKTIAMNRASIMNDGNHEVCAMSLLFSVFTQLFIDTFPHGERLIRFDGFIESGKSVIEESIKNESSKSFH